MNMQIGFHQKIVLICLLSTVILTGCGSPAPTATALPIKNQSDIINPPQPPSDCIEISVSNASPKVGDEISVVGTLKGVVKPTYWGLEVKDEGADASSMLINLMLATPYKPADISQVIKMTSAERSDAKATVNLKIANAGVTNINYFVSAEDFCGTPLGQGVSIKVKITAGP